MPSPRLVLCLSPACTRMRGVWCLDIYQKMVFPYKLDEVGGLLGPFEETVLLQECRCIKINKNSDKTHGND